MSQFISFAQGKEEIRILVGQRCLQHSSKLSNCLQTFSSSNGLPMLQSISATIFRGPAWPWLQHL